MWFVHVYKIIQLQDLNTQLMHKLYPVVGTCTQDYSADARVVSSGVYMYTRQLSWCTYCILCFVHAYRNIQLLHMLYPVLCTCLKDYSAVAHVESCALYMLIGLFSCCTCWILCFVHAHRIIQLLHMLYPVLCTCIQYYSAVAHVVSFALYMNTGLFSCCTCCILCFVHANRIIHVLHIFNVVLCTCIQDYSADVHLVSGGVYVYNRVVFTCTVYKTPTCCTCCIL
jgi:hypothetical protein